MADGLFWVPCHGSENCKGVLVPLSDFSPPPKDRVSPPATVPYKSWACTNPKCRFLLYIDHGTVYHSRYEPARENGRGGH